MTDQGKDQLPVVKKDARWEKILHGEIPPQQGDPVSQEADAVRQVLLWRDAKRHQQEVSVPQAVLIRQEIELAYHRRKRASRLRYSVFVTVLALGMGALGTMLPRWFSDTPVSYAPPNITKADPSTTKAAIDVKVSLLDPPMLVIPAGQFTMGCVPNWDDILGGCRDNEFPSHPVKVKAFLLSQNEVTLREFKQFVKATQYKTTGEIKGVGCVIRDPNAKNAATSWITSPQHSWRNPGFPQPDDKQPVTCMSWNDAQAYIAWLNQETGKAYRLPTEAEWEYAARGGKSTAFSWGDAPNREYANFIGIDGKDQWEFTSPIGQLVRNEFGLSDMAGNVWEWVQDCWHEDYTNAPNTAEEWTEDCIDPALRTRRGGAWDNLPISIRPAYRSKGAKTDRSYVYGFRIAHDK